MEQQRVQRRYAVAEQPLSARDYDVPVGWWGWNWDPPVPMSITQLLAAGNMDARTAALCGMTIAAHGSLLIAAEHPHSGKTTTLTALLDFLPLSTRRVYVRGWAETFDYVKQTKPRETILLANELSSHLPVYLWGEKAVRVFGTLRDGYALGSTLHADSAEEAVAQLTGELAVPAADLARVDLLMVMRIYYDPGAARVGAGDAAASLYGTNHGGYARRVVSLHRLGGPNGSLTMTPLVEHDVEADRHTHDDDAENALLRTLSGGDAQRAELELGRQTELLADLVQRGVLAIPDVRAALAADRGERAPTHLRGDPVQ